jgi:YD repeat-containing protein
MSVNLSNGNFWLQAAQPSGGSYSPVPQLAYNAAFASAASEFGHGWSGYYNQKVAQIDSATVTITKAFGDVYRYTNKTSGGTYIPPAGVPHSLVKNSDGTWTETQPNGFQFRYDTTGKLATMRAVSGARWTLSYNSTRIAKIVDPTNSRTSYVYDGSNNIRRITDTAGRSTTYSVNGSGDLVSKTTPELCQTTYRYDASHRMTTQIAPDGLAPASAMTPSIGWPGCSLRMPASPP